MYDVVVKKVHVRCLISWWVSCWIWYPERVIEEAILRNCWKDEVYLTLESMCLEIGLLTSGIISHNVYKLHDWIILNLIFIRYWNCKLSKKSYNLDSDRCMAKACACLCRQCFHWRLRWIRWITWSADSVRSRDREVNNKHRDCSLQDIAYTSLNGCRHCYRQLLPRVCCIAASTGVWLKANEAEISAYRSTSTFCYLLFKEELTCVGKRRLWRLWRIGFSIQLHVLSFSSRR